DGALPERMHGAERRRCEHGLGVARVALHLVRDAELLQEPQDALRARVLEMMDDDHVRSWAATRRRMASQRSRACAAVKWARMRSRASRPMAARRAGSPASATIASASAPGSRTGT